MRWNFAAHAQVLPSVPLGVLLQLDPSSEVSQFEMTGAGSRVEYTPITGQPKRDDWEFDFDGRRVRDGWEVRRRFLMARTPQEALGFVNAIGDFYLFHGFSYAAFQSTQRYVARCMMTPDTSTWSAKDPNVRELYLKDRVALSNYIDYPPKPWLRLHRRHPIALLVSSGALEVIWATLWLDRFLGAQYGACAKPDCWKRFFKITSRHSRKYCSPECAHVMAVRKSRERDQERSAKPQESPRKDTPRKMKGSHGKQL